jgi:hypothetical protein
MREDWKYPYRVMTRTEEIEANNILLNLFGKLLAIPIILVDTILYKIFGYKGSNIAWIVLVLGVLGYWKINEGQRG